MADVTTPKRERRLLLARSEQKSASISSPILKNVGGCESLAKTEGCLLPKAQIVEGEIFRDPDAKPVIEDAYVDEEP